MIEKSPSDSPFYAHNLAYCERMEDQLAENGIASDGWCTSHGLEINAAFPWKGTDCQLRLFRFQSTQNGVIVPVNAIDTIGCTIAFINPTVRTQFRIGQSKLRRFFTAPSLKAHFPSPYYARFASEPAPETIAALTALCASANVLRFSSGNGKAHFEALTQVDAPLQIIDRLFRIVH